MAAATGEGNDRVDWPDWWHWFCYQLVPVILLVYPAPVKARWLAMRPFLSLWLVLLVILGERSPLQADRILLRNAAIDPNDQSQLHDAHAGSRGGLYLIQFNGPFQEVWREKMEARGVKLLRPVPENAYVVLAQGIEPATLRAFPFVRWVGRYSARYKIHEDLLDPSIPPGSALRVQVLLSTAATSQEANEVRQVFAQVERERRTRFGRILVGSLQKDAIAPLAQRDAVLWMERASQMTLWDEIPSKIVAGGDPIMGGAGSHRTLTQELGLDGRGIVVAVADSGLDAGTVESVHPDLAGRIEGFFAYGGLTEASDLHGHGTHVAGIVAGDGATGETDASGALLGLGVAPGSQLVIQRVFDGTGRFHAPEEFSELTRDAVRSGASVQSNSWGDDTQGRYDLTAAEFDALVRDADPETAGDQPMVLQFSAGNAGPGRQTIGSPAVAKNVIATGASQNDRLTFPTYHDGPEALADFSSRGPAEDGRVKPDLVAPGTWIASLQSSETTGRNSWQAISDRYQFLGGTSQAGPHVAGAAAVFIQYYRQRISSETPSPALVKAALVNSAADLDERYGTQSTPNFQEGWGRVDLVPFVDGRRQFLFVDQNAGLKTGEDSEQVLAVAGDDAPLKITLAYTDVPGFPAAIPALVNDLDLELVGPQGDVYHGNQFLNGVSAANPAAWDRVNNVEQIVLLNPQPGVYRLRVRAYRVAEDARLESPGTDQDYALVVSGDLAPDGARFVFLDRHWYGAPDRIDLSLVDFSAAGQTETEVLVSSTAEPQGERVRLFAASREGIFTNSIVTARGSAQPDGRLQVRHNDPIQVVTDYDVPRPPIVHARADFLPPVISGVTVTSQFGAAVVSWMTDEPATSAVAFGTGGRLTERAEGVDQELSESHQVLLTGLEDGVRYQFVVESADEAGNVRSLDRNQGAPFSVVGHSPPAVLLVDDFDDWVLDLPLSHYTEPLDEAGVSYEVWNVAEQGPPTAEALHPFRVVWWRVPEFHEMPLTPSEQESIRSYLNNGGGLLLASMQILNHLQEGGFDEFRRDVLQVESVTTDSQAPAITGVANDPITAGMRLSLDYSIIPDLGGIPSDLSDWFVPTTNATPIFVEVDSAKVVGIRSPPTGKDSAGRVVFLSLPWDAIPASFSAPNNRQHLLSNILSFLAPGLNGRSHVALDRAFYSVPSLVTVEVADLARAGQQRITANVRTDSTPAGKRVNLEETVIRGLFRGSTALVPADAIPGSERLRAQHGEELVAEYEDGPGGQVLKSYASIDTVRPQITRVEAAPEYEEAVVRWTTSEASDSLVQFGESSVLNRTVYAAERVMEHELRITGLSPNRTYFFQVVSRDPAGNAAVDDGGGDFYSFQTLAPLEPPWVDPFSSLDERWTVQSEWLDPVLGFSSTAWTWGQFKPADRAGEGEAQVGWATNLPDEFVDHAKSDLISPAIYLRPGIRTLLRFQHRYDFSIRSEFVDVEIGQLLISTDNGRSWTALTEFERKSDGWREEQFDLSPFGGRVVRLAWRYELFAYDAHRRTGWQLDRVSVLEEPLQSGSVRVVSNLSQAAFRLEGPAMATGKGAEWLKDPLPPGVYTVRFEPVPFYQTPAPQTNLLERSSVITFRGSYRYDDRNGNRISDEWEQRFFSAISDDYDGTVDSDGDGSDDLSEFTAGTDPTDPASRLALEILPSTASNPTGLTWNWAAVPGFAYRVLSSVDLVRWSPVTDWVRAVEPALTHTVPTESSSRTRFYRVETHP